MRLSGLRGRRPFGKRFRRAAKAWRSSNEWPAADRMRAAWFELRGVIAPDITNLLYYRPRFFGGWMRDYIKSARRTGPWGEVEFHHFQGIVSDANACDYCVDAHPSLDAQERPDLEVMERFLRKLARTPSAIDHSDLGALRAEGYTRAAVEQAVHLCAIMSLINRVASALDFEIQPFRRHEIT